MTDSPARTGVSPKSWEEQPWEEVARSLFGSAARFEVMAWIACRPSTPFFAAQITEETGRYKSSLFGTTIYTRLIEAGMIQRLPVGHGRPGWYRRVDGPLWEVFRVAARVLGTGHIIGESWDIKLRDDLLALRDRYA